MALFKSGNPALGEKTFARLAPVADADAAMTLQGTVNRIAFLLLLVFAGATFTWWLFNTTGDFARVAPFFYGGLSALLDASYPGIAFQALVLTFGILSALLAACTTRLIRVTENFKLVIVSATGGIAVYYLVSLVRSFFGIRPPLIHDNSWFGIGFTLVVVIIAALNLVVDFDFIEKGVESGAPKYMEWYAAFGILVTLVWLYVELLRLLAKLRSRD